MNTATQTQAKQQTPPPALIDATLKREAEKSNAKQALKERVAAKKQEINRQQIAIEMAINLLEAELAYIYRPLMDETAKRHDEGLLDALNLIEIGKNKLASMSIKRYQGYDDCTVDFAQIGSLVNSIVRAYNDHDAVVGRALKRIAPCVDMLMTMIELEGEDE